MTCNFEGSQAVNSFVDGFQFEWSLTVLVSVEETLPNLKSFQLTILQGDDMF